MKKLAAALLCALALAGCGGEPAEKPIDLTTRDVPDLSRQDQLDLGLIEPGDPTLDLNPDPPCFDVPSQDFYCDKQP